MRAIRTALGATTINPDLLTFAEKLQYEGYLRREEANAAILKLAKEDVPIKQIVRRLGCSRKLVRQAIRGETGNVFRTRESTLDTHLQFLNAQWEDGCRNGAELWRRLKATGFRGSQRVVSEWTTRRRRAEKATDQQLQKVPSAKTIARMHLDSEIFRRFLLSFKPDGECSLRNDFINVGAALIPVEDVTGSAVLAHNCTACGGRRIAQARLFVPAWNRFINSAGA